MCVHTHTCACTCLKMVSDPLEAGVTGSYEPSDMKTHTQMAVAVGHVNLSCFQRHHDFLALPAP